MTRGGGKYSGGDAAAACPTCGCKKNPSHFRFCYHCRGTLPRLGAAEPPAPSGAWSRAPWRRVGGHAWPGGVQDGGKGGRPRDSVVGSQ
eukprot:3118641-Pyramimonas_sp.AAC.1